MIVVDSSVWIDFFRGTSTPQVDWLDEHLDREPIVMGDLILAEVLQGFRDDRGFVGWTGWTSPGTTSRSRLRAVTAGCAHSA